MASGGKTPVTTSAGEDQGRGGTVRPRSKSPTKRPSSPKQKQLRSPRGTLDHADAPPASLHAPAQPAPHSNSVPATPHVHARRYSNDHRSPSPIGGVKHDGNTSPRSVRSDSDSRVRPSGRTLFQQSGCRFETGMAYSRRRIPYSIGGDPLDKAPGPIKEKLTAKEEASLTADMQKLYERLLPTSESEERRAKFKEKLERIFNEQWPGNDIKVHVFGSSGNLLCTTESDMDICITAPHNTIGRVCNLAQCLANRGMERIVCIPTAKVPIVRIWDPEYKLACDMNVNNMDAIENTRMIRTYVQIDPRVRPLAMVVKHWTRQRILNDAGMGGTLSSYTWISLVIHFLQARQPAILPSLQQRPHQRTLHADGKRSAFADDIPALSQFGKANKETIGELLFGFFRYFGHEFDYENNVVSIREGRLLRKTDKKWHTSVNNRLCVEEPFNTDRNLGNTVDDYAFRGVHLEIRRAYDLLCDAKLDECCAQYEWPAVEAPFWQKPTPQPLPILSRSRSQTNRSSRSSESSGRNQGKPRHRAAGGSGRRASSAAASNKSSAIANNSAAQGWPADRNNPLSIHETLSQQMHLLQQQEAYFKLQMQQNVLAHSHAQSVAQIPNMTSSSSPRHAHTLRDVRRASHVEPGPLSAPLGSMRSLQNAYFPSQAPGTPRSGSMTPGMATKRPTGTTPSSPSLGGRLVPVDSRRHGQRPLTPEAADMARSRSQPPSSQRTNNGIQQNAYEKYNALHGFPGLQQYQQQWMQAKRQSLKHPPQAPIVSPSIESLHLDGHQSEDNPHPEYVGYYIDNQGRQFAAPTMIHPMSIEQERLYSEGSHQPQTSRSPSPSIGSARDRSYSVQNARPTPPQQTPGSRTYGSLPASLPIGAGGGPIIIDGSGDSPEAHPPSRPSSFYESASSEITATAEERSVGNASPGRDPFIAVDDYNQPTEEQAVAPNSTPRNIVQFGEHEPRPLRSFAERASDLQRPKAHGTLLQGGLLAGGWYDPVAANGLGIEVEPALANQDEQVNALRSTHSNGAQKSVPGDAALAISKATLGSLKPAPLLSPVREVRTPSPTTSRTNTAKPCSSQGRNHHGRAVSLLSGQAVMQQQQMTSPEASRASGLLSGPRTASPKFTSQPFSAIVAQNAGNAHYSNSRASSVSETSRTGTPRTELNGSPWANGLPKPEGASSKPRQGSAPSSIPASTAESTSQGQSQQSGWQQATKRNKKKHKGKNHSISIPTDTREQKGG